MSYNVFTTYKNDSKAYSVSLLDLNKNNCLHLFTTS